MFRGSRVVFIGLIGRFILKNAVTKGQAFGILLCFLGILTISITVTLFGEKTWSEVFGRPRPGAVAFLAASSTEGEEESAVATQTRPQSSAAASSGEMVQGVILCSLGALFGSIQISGQERIYKLVPNTPPMLAIGVEGLAGVYQLLCGPDLRL